MKQGLFSAIVFLISFAATSVVADSVSFKPGMVAPPFEIQPSSPTTSDLISFTTPLDGVVYGNACEAASILGGEPILVRDDVSRTIELIYDGNAPFACPRIFDPTVGAIGEFGPLDAGDWTFSDSHDNSVPFVVVPEPSSWLLISAGLLALAGRLRRQLTSRY